MAMEQEQDREQGRARGVPAGSWGIRQRCPQHMVAKLIDENDMAAVDISPAGVKRMALDLLEARAELWRLQQLRAGTEAYHRGGAGEHEAGAAVIAVTMTAEQCGSLRSIVNARLVEADYAAKYRKGRLNRESAARHAAEFRELLSLLPKGGA